MYLFYLDYNDDGLDPNNEGEEAGRTAADIEVSHASRIDRYLAIQLQLFNELNNLLYYFIPTH